MSDHMELVKTLAQSGDLEDVRNAMDIANWQTYPGI